MLRKDDPVYYKIKLQKLLNQAECEGILVELNEYGILFIDAISKERVIVKI